MSAPRYVYLVVRVDRRGGAPRRRQRLQYGGEWESSRKAAEALALEQTVEASEGEYYVVRKAVLS